MKIFKFLNLLFVLFFMTACNNDIAINSNFLNQSEKNNIIYLVGYNFDSENPLLVKNKVNRDIFKLIYDSLYYLDDTFKHIPCLAETAKVSEDGLKWEITLKNNIKFHDGSDLTSADVVATVDFLLKNNSYYTYNVRNIANVSALGNNRVIINLKEAAQNFLAQLNFPIICSKDLKNGFDFNGTGRFKVDNYIKRKKISLVKNMNYYFGNDINTEKIEIQLVPDNETAVYSYSSGLADVFSTDILNNVDAGFTKSDTTVIEYETDNYTFMLINHNNPVFSDVNIRKAINIAIDRDKLISDILFSHAVKAITPIKSNSYLYNKSLSLETGLDAAKAILSENGYTPNVNTGILEKNIDNKMMTLSFKILVNSENNFRIQVANYISDSLRYIGIDAKVSVVSFEEYQNAYADKSYEAMLATIPMSLDFDLSPFMKSENLSNYNSEMSMLILKNIAASDYDDSKINYYYRLQELFLEEVPHLSLYYTKNILQYAHKIKEGLNPTADNIFYNIEKWSY